MSLFNRKPKLLVYADIRTHIIINVNTHEMLQVMGTKKELAQYLIKEHKLSLRKIKHELGLIIVPAKLSIV